MMASRNVVQPDLANERRKATFETEQLTNIIYRSAEGTKRKRFLQNLAIQDPVIRNCKPWAFCNREEEYERALKKHIHISKRIVELGITNGEDAICFREAGAPHENNPVGVHYGMFIPTIEKQGTEEQKAKYLPLAHKLVIRGTYAQTEMGHGTFIRGIETTATYDPSTKEFVLNTPNLTSMKYWPGSLGKTANFCVVMAQLYTQGKCYGIHTFLLQLRDLNTNRTLPGIETGDIGPKFGFNSNDNGYLRIHNVRIPRENMLMRYSKVLDDGTYVKPPNARLSYGTMTVVRIMICTNTARSLAQACVIAVRYSAVRRQTEVSPGGEEAQILDYRTQQYKLFPNLAKSYAYEFASQAVKDVHSMISEEIEKGTLDQLNDLHALSCGMKAFITWDVIAGIEECRMSCGGHGYSHASGIPKIYTDLAPSCTYEGENSVMILQTARYLMKCYRQFQNGEKLPGFVAAYIGNRQRKTSCMTNSVALKCLEMAYEHRAARLIEVAAKDIDRLVSNGMSPQDAWNASTVTLSWAAMAYCHAYVVKSFVAKVTEAKTDNNTRSVLITLCRFYAVHGIVQNLGEFLQDGYFRAEQVDILRKCLFDTMAEIRPNAVAISDAYDFPDEVLDSCLGRYDGQMPRRRYWKKCAAKKKLRTDVTEEVGLIKNTAEDIDLTEEVGLGKNTAKDLTIDVTEEVGLGKNTAEDLVENLLDDLLDTLPEKLLDTLPEKLLDTLPEKSLDTLPEKLLDTLPEKLLDTLPEKLLDALPEKSLDTLPEKLLDTLNENLPQKSLENVFEHLPHKLLEKSLDTLPEKSLDTLPEKSLDTLPEKLLDTLPENLPEKSLENSHETVQENCSSLIHESDTQLLHNKTSQIFLLNAKQECVVFKKSTFGDFNQADPRFPSVSRGMQCTCNALMSLVISQESHNCTTDLVNSILMQGDEAYRTTIAELHSTENFVSHMLNFDELPSSVKTDNATYNLSYHDIIFGTLTHSQWHEHAEFLNLQEGVYTFLERYNRGLILVGGLCSSIYRNLCGQIVFFDSHSHNKLGLSCPDGKSVMLIFDGRDGLINFLFSYYQSCNISVFTQFEILPVSVEKSVSVSHKVSMHKPSLSAMCSQVNPIPGTTDGNKSNIHSESMLDRYFLYQEKMKTAASKGVTCFRKERKVYMKNYMRKRRDNIEQRDKERAHKQKARKDAKYAKLELARKKKLREISEYRHRELTQKQKTRDNQQYRQLELVRKQKSRENPQCHKHEIELRRKTRENPEYRHRELVSKQKTRENPQCYKHEIELRRKTRENREYRHRELVSKQKTRKNPQCYKHEIELRRKTRENPEYRHRELVSKQKTRENPEYRHRELVSKQKTRENPQCYKHEIELRRKTRENREYRHRELVSKQKTRKNPQYHKHELAHKQKARENLQYSMQELAYKQHLRTNAEYRSNERKNELRSKQKLRKNSNFSAKEKVEKQKARLDNDFKRKELQNDLTSKRKARNDPLYREKERICKQVSRNQHRSLERRRDQLSKSEKRKDRDFCKNEQERIKRKCFGGSIEECIEKFLEQSASGPIYVCTICHQTWFEKSVKRYIPKNFSEQCRRYSTGYKSVNNEEWICNTCYGNMHDEKIPKLSVRNGMQWPDKPDVLNLHVLEERLISQRIPFMQIRELPRGGQLSAKGNVVNVPVDIQPTINALPRKMNEHCTVAVKLKKRMSHKSSCFTENIRPAKVLAALEWLMDHSDLYKNSGLKIDQQWLSEITNSSDEIVHEYTSTTSVQENDDTMQCPEENDDFCELSREDCIEGNSDTLVEDADLDTNKVYVFAPGENQRPLSLYEDKDAEYLCFPTIFCGQKRKDNSERNVNVHYSDIAKWELRSVDRRAAQSVPNLFFKLKKIQMKQVSDKVNLAVRRCKSEGKTITATEARDPSTVRNIVKLNEGYYIFRTLRNSPAYLASKKKDVFAMIRQLGLPTWFMSLSSADTRWPDLLRSLAQLNGEICSEADLVNADWNTKTKLVQKDPVTCARYFDHRVQLFINTVLKSGHAPIGNISDIFRRVEFQNRGSPHIHMLLWTKDAPKYQENSEEEIIRYVDKYVTCSLDIEDAELKELVQLQVHKHSKTCKKKNKPVCRFGFPLPPLSRTMLLEPLESDTDKHKKKYTEIQHKLNEYKDGCNLTYTQFLQDVVQLSEDEYIKCIRASLKGPKIFLKRKPTEVRVNYYNEVVLRAWRANLDIQFVLDPYACAMYIVSYISKSQRGISAMLEKASQEAAEGNMDLKRQVRHIGNKFLNFVEVSAQEASYLVLQMPLTQSSRDVVFINTSPPEKRVFLLKDQDELEALPSNSTDIEASNMIKRYAKRPKQLENWCLADVVSELEIKFPEEMYKEKEEINEDMMADSDDNDLSECFSDEDVLVQLKNGIVIKRRKNKRVIRYVNYSRKTDPENYYREKLFLFSPWRNEENDLLGGHDNFQQHYSSKSRLMTAKQKQYEHHVEEIEQARLSAEDDMEEYDYIAPNTEQIQAEDENEGAIPSEQFVHFDPDTQNHRDYDIGFDIGLPSNSANIETSAVRIPDEEYYHLMQSLNKKQREFHNHVVHWLKTKKEPLYAFLTGGAGVGKSVVIEALYQSLHRLLCSGEGENPEDIRILLCAFTGKAAYNIKGTTIASALHRKMYQTQQNMYADELNTFRTKYRNLSVVIIDEVSMVGNKLLAFIHERLVQLTGTNQDFGGISIIAVGDLYQLSPVGDSWIFNDLSQAGQGLARNLWKEHFSMFQLTQIMRQKDDQQFAQLLNRLRHNNLTETDKQIINSRNVDRGSQQYPLAAPHIFTENKFVSSFNEHVIQNLNTDKITVKADTDVLSATKLSPEVKNQLIKNLPQNHSTTGQLMSELTIAVGMTYDISVNMDVADGLTNGATCQVKFIDYRQSPTRPAIVWVFFSDPKVGRLRRNQYRHMITRDIDNSWTPVFETKRTFMYNRKTFQRIQFPLQPSAAKTIHKAQGATLNEVVVDMSQTRSRKIPHIHYVALSRVRSLENLYILNFNESSLCKDESVDVEMSRLTQDAQNLCFVPLYSLNHNFKLIFNNARSLHKHYPDVKCDPNIKAAHVIGIAESRLTKVDNPDHFHIDGFQIYRNDAECHGTRPHHGIVLYVHNNVQVCKYSAFSSDEVEFSFITMEVSGTCVQTVVLYKKPSCPFTVFQTILKQHLVPLINIHQKLVIVGDFNFDLESGHTNFLRFMQTTFLSDQLIQGSTTDSNSRLDLIFSNIANITSGILETYWSDHSMIYCAVQL